MIKKKLVLADKDELYLVNLSNYLMENAPQLELNVFTREDKLNQYLDRGAKVDILVVDESLAAPELQVRAGKAVKIILSGTMAPFEGFDIVKKYQKSASLLNQILLLYAQNTGSVEAIKGQSRTKTAVIYSPAGGTGKTVLALALAAACAKKGMRTFYLNLEEIDSVKDILAPAQGSLSDVILALKTEGINVGIKLASCAAREENSGFFYLSGVESISENEEISGDEVKRLIETLRSLSEYDILIVDTTSGISERTRCTLESADIIFVPMVSEESAVSKMQRFLGEGELHEVYDSIFQKMSLVINKSGMSGPGKELRESGILNRLPCCCSVMSEPMFLKRMNILRSGDILCQVMGPMIQVLTEA